MPTVPAESNEVRVHRSQRWASASVLASLAAVALCACTDDEIDLLVDLRTDYRAGVEFDLVRVELSTVDGAAVRGAEAAISRSQDFLMGRRIAELGNVPLGLHVLSLDLVSAGDVIARADVVLDIGATRGVTVTITRDCRGMSCSAPGTSCLNGRCLADACSLGETVGCEPACASPSDCPAGAACANALCAAGVCLLAADDSACAAGICLPETGCESVADAGTEPDAGSAFDAGPLLSDAGRPDAGFDPRLVLWLPFDAPEPLSDATGHGLAATCVAPRCPSFVEGRRAQAASFDGVDDGLVVAHDPRLDTPAGFSVLLWVRPEVNDRVDTLVAKPLGTGDANSWELYRDHDGTLRAAVAGHGSFVAATLLEGAWIHVALVWNGADAMLYVDGSHIATAPKPDMLFDTHGVYVGVDEDGGLLVNHFHGLIDDVRIYDRALTQLEILAAGDL
jgi:hypothetical protein